MMLKMRTWGGHTVAGSEKEMLSVRSRKRFNKRKAKGTEEQKAACQRGRQGGRKEAKAMGAGVKAVGALGHWRLQGGCGGPRNPGCAEVKGPTSMEGRGAGSGVEGRCGLRVTGVEGKCRDRQRGRGGAAGSPDTHTSRMRSPLRTPARSAAPPGSTALTCCSGAYSSPLMLRSCPPSLTWPRTLKP